MKRVSLLIVEDEEAIRDMLRFSLPANEFSLLDAENIDQAIRLLSNRIPDLIILDWMLPGKSGIDFLKWIKQQELLKQIPIIMLTAKAEEENKIKGLMAGADDYITKPFSITELTARIKTVLRRGILVSPENEVRINQLILNIAKHTVSVEDQSIKLMPNEYKMLHFFMTHPNKTYTREQLINYIYGASVYIDNRSIDVQVKRLRHKLKPYGYDQLIQTVRGVGYQLIQEQYLGKRDEKK
jgi:two-component system, OmpR family, phosphate regulon response regulator PhoB